MKVQGHDNALETNVQGESKEFGIGDASVVIEILRNRLYQNKIQTLVQEYVCNARDAMREVGKGNEFQITVPTRQAPTFKVRDFGPGISPERMDKVFRLYGASTKRGTNNQTGGFGIGAKSAWSYTDSFTVTTVVDGTRRTYVCHTGTNSQGSIDLVATDHTDENNGTEIQIAVQRNDIPEFLNAIMRAIYFWEVRPELIGYGMELPTLTGGYKISANIETIDRNAVPGYIGLGYGHKGLAVIDGVPYPLSENLLLKAKQLEKFIDQDLRKMAILHFGNGLVGVSASRESIDDSAFSVAALNKMGVEGAKVVAAHVSGEFAKAKSTAEWMAAYRSLSPYFDVDSHAKYGDYKIVDGRIVSDRFKNLKMTMVHCLDKRGRNKVDRITKEELTRDYERSIHMDLLSNVFLVTKEEGKVVQNKRLRAFFENKPTQLSKVILLEFSTEPENLAKIVTDLGVVEFETLEFTEEPKAERVKVEREHAEFCIHSFNGLRHQYTTLATNTQKYLYVEVKDGDYEGFNTSDLRELSYHLSDQGLKVIGLAPRALKMAKGDPNFTPLKDWLAAYVPGKAEVNFTIAQKAQNMNDIESIIGLDGIEDDFLVEMTKEYKSIRDGVRKIREIPALLQSKVSEVQVTKDFLDNDQKLAKLLQEKYPLVKEIGRYCRSRKELVIYINAKYTN